MAQRNPLPLGHVFRGGDRFPPTRPGQAGFRGRRKLLPTHLAAAMLAADLAVPTFTPAPCSAPGCVPARTKSAQENRVKITLRGRCLNG